MRVSVLLFGHYSDYFPDQPLSFDLPDGATVHDIAVTLEEHDTRLIQLERRCRFAIEEEYASQNSPLFDGCTVAVLPPMSGG